MTYVEIIPGLMKLDVNKEYIDIQKIWNRRFMYCPATGILVLGVQYPDDSPMVSSHAQELAEAGITSGFDSFVRGWIGAGKEYPKKADYQKISCQEQKGAQIPEKGTCASFFYFHIWKSKKDGKTILQPEKQKRRKE